MSMTFTDDLSNNGSILKIKKVHIQELRTYLSNHVGLTGNNDTDPNLTHPLATTSNPGFMSAADKTLIDNLSVNAGTVLAVSGQAPITSSGGTNPTIGITPASSSSAGSMSIADYNKLSSYPVWSAVDARLTALEAITQVRSIGVDSTPSITITGTALNPTIKISDSTQTQSGLMSGNDKKKLDSMSAPPIGGTMLWFERPDLNLTRSYCFDGKGKYIEGRGMDGWVICGPADNGLIDGIQIPDFTNRFALGAGARTAGTKSQSDDPKTANYGAEAVKISSDQLPSHKHIFGGDDSLALFFTSNGTTMNIDMESYWTGHSQKYWTEEGETRDKAHPNMPPYIVAWYIMRIS